MKNAAKRAHVKDKLGYRFLPLPFWVADKLSVLNPKELKIILAIQAANNSQLFRGWFSVRFLAEKTGLTRSTVQTYLSAAIKSGRVSVERLGARGTRKLKIPAVLTVQESTTTVQDSVGTVRPAGQNCPASRTTISLDHTTLDQTTSLDFSKKFSELQGQKSIFKTRVQMNDLTVIDGFVAEELAETYNLSYNEVVSLPYAQAIRIYQETREEKYKLEVAV